MGYLLEEDEDPADFQLSSAEIAILRVLKRSVQDNDVVRVRRILHSRLLCSCSHYDHALEHEIVDLFWLAVETALKSRDDLRVFRMLSRRVSLLRSPRHLGDEYDGTPFYESYYNHAVACNVEVVRVLLRLRRNAHWHVCGAFSEYALDHPREAFNFCKTTFKAYRRTPRRRARLATELAGELDELSDGDPDWERVHRLCETPSMCDSAARLFAVYWALRLVVVARRVCARHYAPGAPGMLSCEAHFQQIASGSLSGTLERPPPSLSV